MLRPYIQERFGEQLTQAGPKVSLKCVATGTPLPVITWALDKSPIRGQSQVVITDFVNENGDVVSFLNVTSVRLHDSGLYRCTAENVHGADFWEARVNVYG